MITRFASRMLTEVAPRPLVRFGVNFGLKGMMAVHAFKRRIERDEFFPAFLFLSVTDRCNLRCQGCWVSSNGSKRELDLDSLDRLIVESARKGVSTFGILGGEPLMHEGLLELFARHPESYFLLFTNGTMITDEVAERLRQLANVSPLISIEGRESVSDERRGGSGVYERSMKGVDQCRRQGLVTGVATSVCASNYDDLVNEAFVRELVERGVHYLWFYIYRPVGPDPAPELVLKPEQILGLRRFMVDIRSRVPMLIVDSYWDHDGRAMCPAAVGIGYHVGPGGDIEPCPPVQFARENINQGKSLADLVQNSQFLARFREVASTSTRGCLLMERPELLLAAVAESGAHDSSGRGSAVAELKSLQPCPSHHVPDAEIPESYWPYRLAKKNWFFGFGAYG
ncbi:MAG: radical SAM protein [bacterium]|nr:radical SAM protein [bacterium]